MSDKPQTTKRIKLLEQTISQQDRLQAAQDRAQDALHKRNIRQREALAKIIDIAKAAL